MQNIVELQDKTTINKKNTTKINSRFGELEINLDKKINFPQGIIGLASYNQYVLADFPDQIMNNEQLKILQSIEDENISFIILPIGCDGNKLFGGMIDEQDIIEACNSLNFDYQQIALLLILNIKKKSENYFENYVNLKAPIFIDVKKMEAAQYILRNNKYEISKKI